MSAEVKREHREAAHTAYYQRALRSEIPVWSEWAEGGTAHTPLIEILERVAQAIADADARARDETDDWWRVRLSTALADRSMLQREREKQGPG